MISSGWSPNNILVKSSRANPFSKNIPPVFLVLFWNCSGLGPEVIMIEELFFLNGFFSNLHAPHKFFGSACRVQMNLHQHSVGSMPVRFFLCIGKYAFRPQLAWLWKLTFGFFQVSRFWGKHRGNVRKRLGWTRRIHIVEYPPVNIQKNVEKWKTQHLQVIFATEFLMGLPSICMFILGHEPPTSPYPQL